MTELNKTQPRPLSQDVQEQEPRPELQPPEIQQTSAAAATVLARKQGFKEELKNTPATKSTLGGSERIDKEAKQALKVVKDRITDTPVPRQDQQPQQQVPAGRTPDKQQPQQQVSSGRAPDKQQSQAFKQAVKGERSLSDDVHKQTFEQAGKDKGSAADDVHKQTFEQAGKDKSSTADDVHKQVLQQAGKDKGSTADDVHKQAFQQAGKDKLSTTDDLHQQRFKQAAGSENVNQTGKKPEDPSQQQDVSAQIAEQVSAGLRTDTPVQEVSAPPVPEPPKELHKVVQEIASRILTSTQAGGQSPEVRIQLKESVFAGSEVRVFRDQGDLRVVFIASNPDAEDKIAQSMQQMESMLKERLPNEKVRMRVEGRDHEGQRDRGQGGRGQGGRDQG